MSNYAKLYWFTRLDNIQGIFIAVSVIFGIVIIASIINRFIVLVSDGEIFKVIFLTKTTNQVVVITLFVLGVISASLVPNKSEAILIMAGGKTLDYVGKDTSLQKLPYQATSIISSYLEKEKNNIEKELKENK